MPGAIVGHMSKYLRFTRDAAGKITVHAGAERVGTIRDKYVRTDADHIEAINAFVASTTRKAPTPKGLRL